MSWDGSLVDFSNFGSLKSTETWVYAGLAGLYQANFSNFGSLKSTETRLKTAFRVAIFVSAISAR